MNEIIRGIASPLLPAAVEANLCAENAVFGRHLPGAEFHDDGDLVWWITGVDHPMYNAAWLARFTAQDCARRVDETLARFRARGVPLGWTVGPATAPPDLADHLRARGAVLGAAQTAMAADLSGPARGEGAALPAGVQIREARTPGDLRLWRVASNRGFEADEQNAALYDAAYLALGAGPHLPWRHYLGLLHGQPVAAASLLLHGGVAGIYGVATAPEARRQGIGAAMTRAAMRGAREQGHAVAILFPSLMARGIYTRLGFGDLCRVEHYALSP